MAAYTVVTVFIFCQTKKSADAAKRSADAAKISADIAQLSERPWIKILDVQAWGNGPVVPALSFQDAMGHQQATFNLKVSVKNIGHSVAEIAVRPELFFPLWKDFGKSVPDEQKRFCDSDYGKALSGYYPSTILFPDEPFDWHGSGAQFVDTSNTNHLPPQFGNAAYVVPVI